METTYRHTEVSFLREGRMFTFQGCTGRVVSVHRPRTDYPFVGPATRWTVEFVEGPEDDRPVYSVTVPAGTLIETWS